MRNAKGRRCSVIYHEGYEVLGTASLRTCPQVGCYSVMLSQQVYQTASSRQSSSLKGSSVWWTKVKL